MSVQPAEPLTDTRPDLFVIEHLDFEPEITCEIVGCPEINGTRQPAELLVDLLCKVCPRRSRLLICQPCWDYITTNLPQIGCKICETIVPLAEGFVFVGRLR